MRIPAHRFQREIPEDLEQTNGYSRTLQSEFCRVCQKKALSRHACTYLYILHFIACHSQPCIIPGVASFHVKMQCETELH